MVHSFFNALETEDPDTKLNIQEALVLMIDAFRNSKPEEKSLLLTLLFQYVEKVYFYRSNGNSQIFLKF